MAKYVLQKSSALFIEFVRCRPLLDFVRRRLAADEDALMNFYAWIVAVRITPICHFSAVPRSLLYSRLPLVRSSTPGPRPWYGTALTTGSGVGGNGGQSISRALLGSLQIFTSHEISPRVRGTILCG